MRPGSLVDNRYYLAALAQRFHRIAVLAVHARRFGWLAYGWRMTALAATGNIALWATGLVILTSPHVSFMAVAGFLWAMTVWVSVNTFTEAGAVAVAVTAVLLTVVHFAYREQWKTVVAAVAHATLAATLAAVFGGWVWTMTQTGLTLGAAMTAMIPVCVGLDMKFDRMYEPYEMKRLAGMFRRELPDRFTILAAKSPKIQSLAEDQERTVAEAAIDRPILEHPPLSMFMRFDGRSMLVRCWRTPGRALPELKDVLDEVSAQWNEIEDFINSVELIPDDPEQGLKFASSATLRVWFKPRDKAGVLATLRRVWSEFRGRDELVTVDR